MYTFYVVYKLLEAEELVELIRRGFLRVQPYRATFGFAEFSAVCPIVKAVGLFCVRRSGGRAAGISL